MYNLTSSMSDRTNFDSAMFAWADECIRGAEMPVHEINIEEFAREKLELDRGWLEESVDDIEEAEARYLDAFRRAWIAALRERVEEIELLQMPNEDSLEVPGDAAGVYADNGGYPDGDLLLAPARLFTPDQITVAKRAGGRVVAGYAVPYPRGVCIDREFRYEVAPGSTTARGWCGYGIDDVAYALDSEVAAKVWAASLLAQFEEEGEGD